MGGDDHPASIWGDFYGPAAKKLEGPCLWRFSSAVLTGACAGTFFGSLQIAWFPDPVTSSKKMGGVVGKTDARAVVSGLMRPALWMAATGAAFSSAECLAESLRNKDDSWNAFIGGMAAGAVMAAITKRFDYMTGSAIATGLFMGIVDLTGTGVVSRPEELHVRMHHMLPETHKESQDLAALKVKYPKFKYL